MLLPELEGIWWVRNALPLLYRDFVIPIHRASGKQFPDATAEVVIVGWVEGRNPTYNYQGLFFVGFHFIQPNLLATC